MLSVQTALLFLQNRPGILEVRLDGLDLPDALLIGKELLAVVLAEILRVRDTVQEILQIVRAQKI